MIISKITPGLRFEKDDDFAGYYYYKNLHVKKGDLQVNLDAPLAVIGDILVAGNITAPNGINAAGRLAAKGNITSDALVSSGTGHIKAGGNIHAGNNLEGNGIIAGGTISVGRHLVSNSFVECGGSIKVNGCIHAETYIDCKEQIHAGLKPEEPENNTIYCAELRNGEIAGGRRITKEEADAE